MCNKISEIIFDVFKYFICFYYVLANKWFAMPPSS